MATEGQVNDTSTAQPTDTSKATDTSTAAATNTKVDTSTPNPERVNNAGDTDARFKGIQTDLAKERKTRQALERQIQELTNRYSERDRQFQALAGVKQPTADEQEAETIRSQFKKIFPELGELTADDIKALRELASKRGDIEAVERNHWNRHGQSMVDTLAKEVSDFIGGELTDKQRRALVASYITDVQQDKEQNGDEGELYGKYTSGDVAHLKEYAKAWAEDWLTAAKRKVTAQNVGQFRAVPRSGDRSITTTGGKKIDVTDNKAVEDLLVEGFRSRGGEFGRGR